MKEIDLDAIMLSQESVMAWNEIARRLAVALKEMKRGGKVVPPPSMEWARVNDDGTLTIFVEVIGVVTASLDIQAGHWFYQH